MERADGMGRKKVPSGPRRAGREASWEQGCGCARTLPEASFSGGAWDVDRQGRGRGHGEEGRWIMRHYRGRNWSLKAQL